MKKSGILNSSIAKIAADLGHKDMICVADCGLPINNDNKIDLAIDYGKPTIKEVVSMLKHDIEFEEITLAKEIVEINSTLYLWLKSEFKDIKISYISHKELKKQTKNCKAVIRTGENTPYANIIFHSAVVFERRF